MDLSAAELLVIEAEEKDRIARWITGRPVKAPFPLIGRFICLCRGAHAWSPRKQALFAMGHDVSALAVPSQSLACPESTEPAGSHSEKRVRLGRHLRSDPLRGWLGRARAIH